jgi:hypothetical protein
MPRREFLRALTAFSAATALPRASGPAAQASRATSRKVIGLQVGAVSFLDEGVEQVLDNLQTRY